MKVYKGKSPCYKCDRRNATCHSNCQEYKDWQATGIEEPAKTYRAKKTQKAKGY